MVLDPLRAIPRAVQRVTAADFTSRPNALAFNAIVQRHEAGLPIGDPLLLQAALKSAGWTPVEIFKLLNAVPNAAHVVYYAERVRDFARVAKLLGMAGDLMAQIKASTNNPAPEDILAWLDAKVLSMRNTGTTDAKPIAAVFTEVIDELAARVGKEDRAVLLSGLPTADERGFVFAPGELAILAARPGVGKTSLATQIAMHHGSKGRPVLLASLEMRATQVASRVLVAAAGLNHQIIRTCRIDENCINDLRTAAGTIGDPAVRIWSPGRVRVGQIHAMASIVKAATGLRMLVVDYVGLVRPDDHRVQRNEQIGQITKGLRDIGQQLEIPVLAMCQLNRESEKERRRPQLSNLRESGDIEQDADMVAFLHAADAKDPTYVELIVAKNRQGAAGGIVPLRWRPEQTRFDEPEARDNPNYRPELDSYNDRNFQ